MEKKKLDLFKCVCKNCPMKQLCGLLTGQYCSYSNCVVPEPSEW